VSPNAKELTGYANEELFGRKLTDFLVDESKDYFSEQVKQHLNKRLNGDPEQTNLHEVQFICKNNVIKWVEVSANLLFEEGEFIGYIGTTRDIAEKKEYELRLSKYIEELKKVNEELKKTATIDILTGAYNRRQFEEDINVIINNKDKQAVQFSLILFDIDRFKTINDYFGHKIGDHGNGIGDGILQYCYFL